MGTIYISYGITKSASTFAWQLIKRIAICGGLPIATLTSKSKGANSPEDYIDPVSGKNLNLIREDVGDLPVVIKTHGDVTPAAARLVAEGTAQVFASYRDLRDVALSLLDHAARSRAKGIKDFSEFRELTDTVEAIKAQVQRFENWVQLCNPLLLSYDEVCFDTRSTISRIAERLRVSVDDELIFGEFNGNKASIGQFNKGERRRFEREMDAETSALFVDAFAPYYKAHFPDEIQTMNRIQTASSTAAEAVVPAGTRAIASRHGGRTQTPNPGTYALGRAPAPEGDPVPKVLIDELVTAAYKAILGRPADPSGLQTYGKLFTGVPLSQGIERAVRGLLGSAEFQSKRAVAGEQPSSPFAPSQICPFTPKQTQCVSSLGTRMDRVLIARFRPDPGSRPTIHLQDRSLLSVYRVLHSVRYVETLISKYLLHQDYYYVNFSSIIQKKKELFCVFQIDDRAVDDGNSVAYCGMGSKLTLIPDLQFWIYNGYFNQREEISASGLQWEDRLPRVFWRGSSTGAEPITLESLPHLPRFRLCAAAADRARFGGVLDAKLTDIVQASNAKEAENIRTYVNNIGLLSARVPQAEFVKYRYQIDIDGNSNSWGLLPKLMTGSCVLKVLSDWHQWYYDGLQPWEHYVPIKNDLSDLEERVTWCLENDEHAREIGANGMKYASGIVFGTEMLKAAASVLEASCKAVDAPF